MKKICVAHLVRKANGIAPFERFIASYVAHSAGVPHDLLFIFKGAFQAREIEDYDRLLHDIPHIKLHVWDYGFDIRAYLKATRVFDYPFFCFLNSYSVILCEDWLLKMYSHISREGVGLAGATGSCESIYTTNLRASESVPHKMFSPAWFIRVLRLALLSAWFDPFPNHHIRTNAFLIRRGLFRVTKSHPLISKINAHRFESGKRNLSRQIMNMGLQVLVVGRDGRAYEKENWFHSNTFRTGDQQNLLVADNQTSDYAKSNSCKKQYLSYCAWGK